MKDKIILTVKGLRQAIYTLRNKRYSDENICIYLTKETIIEYAKTMKTKKKLIMVQCKKAKELLNKGVFTAS